MSGEDPKKKLLSDTASLSSESDHEGPPSNVSTTEIPPPSELKEEGIACSTVADPPPYSDHMPPPPAVGDPVWGKPPIVTGATQQPGTTVMVQPFPPSHPHPSTMPPPPNHLPLSLFALFCCFFPLGIVALIKSLEVDKLHASGAYERAKEASKKAHYWAMLSVKIGVALYIINVILGVVSAVIRVVVYSNHS